MGTSALLLSGGESSRFGGAPKALLPVGETTSIRRLAETTLGAGCDPVIAVVGRHKGPIVHELRGLDVGIVDSENWESGRTASVQAGLLALPPADDVLFWPVDHPFVAGSTVDTLLRVREHDPLAVWFLPTYQGQGGHPVVWRPPVRADILELRADAPIRALLEEFGPQVRRCPVDDPGIRENVDTPEQYRAAYEAWRERAAI